MISVSKRLLGRWFFTLLTLLWMILIFYMSSAEKDDSSAQSGVIYKFLCVSFIDEYERMPPDQQLQLQNRFSFPVRKGAHLTEYTILGILLSLSMVSYIVDETFQNIMEKRGEMSIHKKQTRKVGTTKMPITPALIIGFLYAVSDEIHQYFVPGRSAKAQDVLIDTAGIFVGICIVHGFNRIQIREQIAKLK